MTNIASLNYTSYDRQLELFCSQVKAFVAGWEDYSASELSLDIHSLCTKASRLCLMVDQDVVTQQQALTPERQAANRHWHDQMALLVFHELTPLLHRLLLDYQRGEEILAGHRQPRFGGQLTDILPYLGEMLDDGSPESKPQFQAVISKVNDIQDHIEKGHLVTPTIGERPIMRFWYFCELFCYTSYIYYRLFLLVNSSSGNATDEELERLFTESIAQYAESEEGQLTLQTFASRLRFDHHGILCQEQLLEKGRELVKDIAEKLQLLYMNHRNHPDKMASEIVRLQPTGDELKSLVVAIAKWNTIRRMVHDLNHPPKESKLQNTIFRSDLQGMPIDLDQLRERISRMAQLVVQKNQWFCVWCILKHHNLLANLHFEPFATQMMQPDWFGGANVPQFRGDNISDYLDYFGETDYRLWDIKAFRTYRDMHGKPRKKWSDKLFSTFHRLCYQMDEAYNEQDEI